ncbi:putative thioredoxin-like, sieve element occlusion [Medicago truncatula]|uniref:Putative thioredoxin-like, sieve element occlusion n=1 Tax=Medicago truncatula TaxID=3880 RepID=E2FKJ1_MEDTR|nr:protein SIEVE ELEMENT OCCLUSION B [Medicago truncatula]ADN32803.1 sieve element occlusion by forisomes 2 [Medicago truncatula]AES61031.1 sieve element occlusion protein [Medicago truncatula]RHN80322.1 putative thioredoxin-like, sieve element occlusion [Medicago truncatula]
MSTALSYNVPISGTTTQKNDTSQQQKSQLPNPFKLEDIEILNKVYLTHVNDNMKYDRDTLFNLVSNIISASTQTSGTNSGLNTQISFKPDFSVLKRISCQMITTRGTAECAHQTTMWVLHHLRGFSWEAKALITLAAFSLEYGAIMHLHRIQSSDTLGNSLKQLSQVQFRKVPADITELVTFLLQVLQDIKTWAAWSAFGYDLDDVNSLPDAMQWIPLVVYWTVATIVACTGNLVGISEHKLSDYVKSLSDVVKELRRHLKSCELEIGKIHENENLLKDSDNIKDVVAFLRLLIKGNGTDQIPPIFIGNDQVKTGIEVFKKKHVLLFVSGLDTLRDEILLLNSIYKRLQDKPQEVLKGSFKKEDFKILWIPIVNKWDEDRKKEFKNLKESMKWYVLEHFSELPGRGIIKKKLNYDIGYPPILAVINPQGDIINKDAMEIIFQWGIDAFPFRISDAEDIFKKWEWFWKLMKKVDVNIEKMSWDRYIFIYGGNDPKWIQDFTRAIGSIKKHQTIQNVDVNIDYHQLGKNNPTEIPYFWMGIDGRKQQNKTCKDSVDCEIQTAVKKLLCLKQDPLGWVLLSRGRHVTVFGHGEPMYQTVADFDKWKNNVVEKESFDEAFKEYYDTKLSEISSSASCAVNSSDVLATITCPNPFCGRVMEVTSVNYKCCHRDDPDSCCI